MSTQSTTGPRIESHNPATGEVIGSVPVMDEAEVRERVQRARKAQEGWVALDHRERARQLLRVQDWLAANARTIAERLSAETGKPRFDSLLHEVTASCELIKTLSREAPKVLAPTRVSSGLLLTKKAWKVYEPHGVIGVISPWNFPLTLAMSPTVTALYAGNAVVLKPSEVTPLVGDIVAEAFTAAEVHPDVVQVLSGDGSTGAALVHAGVDKIAFTGSTRTGKKIMAAAAETLTPVVMELGGKDPMVVCADADIENAAAGAVWAGFANSGQICMSIERVYVPEAVHDRFVDAVVERTEALRQGVDSDEHPVDVGAMIAPTQAAIVEAHIADARDKGAEVLTGGVRRSDLGGDFFAPTVLTGCTHDMDIVNEETFGPVLPIVKVRDEDEAVRLANDSRYGLTASVWTANRAKGERIARELKAGSVLINDHITVYAITELPFGGIKESGFGRVHGVEGLLEFARPKSVVLERLPQVNRLLWFPYPKAGFDVAARATGFLYRTNPVDKVKALLGL
ncbi:MAG: aldehyde dehydrogenase family protein [Acidimicrobiia bacterium]|nr:aldehyde dehydrogenase family protein [Acidimicrobiia bacterium]